MLTGLLCVNPAALSVTTAPTQSPTNNPTGPCPSLNHCNRAQKRVQGLCARLLLAPSSCSTVLPTTRPTLSPTTAPSNGPSVVPTTAPTRGGAPLTLIHVRDRPPTKPPKRHQCRGVDRQVLPPKPQQSSPLRPLPQVSTPPHECPRLNTPNPPEDAQLVGSDKVCLSMALTDFLLCLLHRSTSSYVADTVTDPISHR